jgi:hypothetical protein
MQFDASAINRAWVRQRQLLNWRHVVRRRERYGQGIVRNCAVLRGVAFDTKWPRPLFPLDGVFRLIIAMKGPAPTRRFAGRAKLGVTPNKSTSVEGGRCAAMYCERNMMI